ncbi:MAG: alginate lyase family protein [Vicinamibacterales bacterium]
MVNLRRLGAMTAPEVAWRARAAADNLRWRAAARLRAPRWHRRSLAAALAPDPLLADARRAVGREDWSTAQAALARYFHDRPGRFVIAPHRRRSLAPRIRARFPAAAAGAARRAERLLAGRYDVLGYRDVPFDGRDWQFDPVHRRRPPRVFWSRVPFLDPGCGDHKIIWELNRHQHWLALGRAYWLTGDRRCRDAVLTQLGTWLEDNPPRDGINWASALELAFRCLSWLWALHLFVDRDTEDEAPWLVDLLLGLDMQLGHVERHLSHYFSPNTHLLGEGLALYVTGRTLPELAASPRREALGRRILMQEATRQVLPDGGHAERSAHYHRYALDFYVLALAVADITNDPAAGQLREVVGRLGGAARLLADGHGVLPHLGDDDGGMLLPLTGREPDDAADSLAMAAILTGRDALAIGPPPEEVWWLLGHRRFAGALDRLERQGPQAPPLSGGLPDTGYWISRSGADHLVVDAGPHGYLNGGHAHADALSLTFGRHGHPLLIDPGTACYTIDGRTRDRFRSSAFHNTLTLDGRSQSVPRGPFHWQHVADGRVRNWLVNGRFDYLDATEDGYAPLVHRRRIFALHDDLLVVADLVTGDHETHDAAVHWHVHPDWTVAAELGGAELRRGRDLVSLTAPSGTLASWRGDVTTGLGWHAPVYGRLEPATTLRLTASGSCPLWVISVFGLDAANAVRHVESVPVIAEAGALSPSAGVRVVRARSTDHVVFAEPARDTEPTRWRIRGIECDARLLFARERRDGGLDELAMVEGTTALAGGRGRVQVTSPRAAGHLHLAVRSPHGATRPAVVLQGALADVRVAVDGVTLPVAAAGGAAASLIG